MGTKRNRQPLPAIVPEHALVLTRRQVATLLQACEKTVARLDSDGLLPGKIQVGRAVRYRRSEIMAWIERGCPAAATAAG